MFFFFEDENPILSGMAFGTYVINVLRDYLAHQGKTITTEVESDVFDALLPDGIDDIEGPLFLGIKTGFSNNSGYFRNVERFAFHASKASPGPVLLILGTKMREESKQGMARLVESRGHRKAYIWDIEYFNNLTEEYAKKYREYIDFPEKAIVDDAINRPSNKRESDSTRLSLISALKREYQNEELALFLGAGVSKDAGIPKWNELINALLSKMISTRIKEKNNSSLFEHLESIIDLAHKNQENSPITQVRYIKCAFSPEEYNELVHEVLYSNKPQSNTELLNSIAAICTPRRHHMGVQGIITYNFDDLLERCLARNKVQTNVLACENDKSTPDKLSIFHVHGFMPKKLDENTPDSELILSEEDYHRVYRDAYCWSNLAQLNYLREHTCLFIGCSLTDPNLRRLLDVAKRNNEKPRHYAFLRRSNIANCPDIDQKALEAYKDIDLSLREKYYAALGLNIIWIDKFEEIPQILRGLL